MQPSDQFHKTGHSTPATGAAIPEAIVCFKEPT